MEVLCQLDAPEGSPSGESRFLLCQAPTPILIFEKREVSVDLPCKVWLDLPRQQRIEKSRKKASDCGHVYSQRSATAGSMRAARRAGTRQASPATTVSATATIAKLVASCELMPCSTAVNERDNANAASTPVPIPTAATTAA